MRFGFSILCLTLASLGQALAQAPVAPFVVTHPASQNTLAATSITLTASIDGTPPIYYQWRRNGVDIAGEKAPFLIFTTSLPTGQNSSFTSYDLVAFNSTGTVTTNAAQIYVEKRTQTITFAAPPAVVSAGGGVTLSAPAPSPLPPFPLAPSPPATFPLAHLPLAHLPLATCHLPTFALSHFPTCPLT